MSASLAFRHEATRQHRRGTCSCPRQEALAQQRRRDRAAGRWPFGGPSLSTVRRWTRELYLAGRLERTVVHTGKPGRPPYLYSLTDARRRELENNPRSLEDSVTDERVITILKRARGKPLTEDEIFARYKAAMDRRNAQARELENAT